MTTLLGNMSVVFKAQLDYDKALAMQHRALKIRKENRPFDHLRIAQHLTEIGDILYQQEEYDDAC